jgi:hypothetical protein
MCFLFQQLERLSGQNLHFSSVTQGQNSRDGLIVSPTPACQLRRKRRPEPHANIIAQIGDAAVEFVQHCVEQYDEAEEQKLFLVRVCEDAAEFIHDCAKDAVEVQLQQQLQENVPDQKAPKRRRGDDDEDWDNYDPEDPQPPIDLVPACRSRKAARRDEANEEEEQEDNLPEEGAEDAVMVFGPGNPASVPFQELNKTVTKIKPSAAAATIFGICVLERDRLAAAADESPFDFLPEFFIEN